MGSISLLCSGFYDAKPFDSNRNKMKHVIITLWIILILTPRLIADDLDKSGSKTPESAITESIFIKGIARGIQPHTSEAGYTNQPYLMNCRFSMLVHGSTVSLELDHIEGPSHRRMVESYYVTNNEVLGYWPLAGRAYFYMANIPRSRDGIAATLLIPFCRAKFNLVEGSPVKIPEPGPPPRDFLTGTIHLAGAAPAKGSKMLIVNSRGAIDDWDFIESTNLSAQYFPTKYARGIFKNPTDPVKARSLPLDSLRCQWNVEIQEIRTTNSVPSLPKLVGPAEITDDRVTPTANYKLSSWEDHE